MQLIPGDATGGRPFPCSVLHCKRFTFATSVTLGAVGSYPTISPLPIFTEAKTGGLFSAALSVR